MGSFFSGIRKLKQKILEASQSIIRVNNSPILDQPVPTWFHCMVKSIEELRSMKDVPIITREQLSSLMKEISGQKDLRLFEFDEAVTFLKDRGKKWKGGGVPIDLTSFVDPF